MLERGAREQQLADESYADFVARYPSYGGTELLDKLRATEYRRAQSLRFP